MPELRSPGQKSPAELIDRYSIACRPIRDLLVEYLRERQPAVDYSSLVRLAGLLGKLFWSDLERHHPGISSLRLSTEVVDAWKQRLRTVTTRTRTPGGEIVETTSPRLDYFGVLVAVRALYPDLAQWALEDPARWGPWVAPCPISGNEIDRRKEKRHRKSRMDTRTRERLPVLPVLVRSVAERRTAAAELLAAAAATPLGDRFTAAGQTLVRSHTKEKTPGKLWAHDPDTGQRRDLAREEAHAFWAFAAVEVLRATGIRIEELSELSHHSLIQYRLPSTGEVVPLLQIAPSKTDAERLLLVSPELADVLSLIIRRIRGADGAVPQVAVFDLHERTWSDPAPLLFQRRLGSENQAIGPRAIREMLTSALSATGLTEPSTGRPLRCTPHDFRRMFITDAILNGLPPHIAQVIAGHRDINVTMGYKAVYPDEAIQAHHAFLARRRALRPTDEYRVPTDAEWEEFLGHFERRKVSTGTCGRSFGTPCLHEHACIRCPMLWPDPNQRERLVEIRDNLHARITEAEREGWLGEVEGLQISLAAAEDKLAQIDRRIHDQTTADLGIPLPPKPQS
ncbi:site-specific integrase, partial [Rhodococcus ruber]|nr:site-specific integrase [Rhodococcus ruber]